MKTSAWLKFGALAVMTAIDVAGAAHPESAEATAPVSVIRKARICISLPRAQLGQGTNGVDVAEPVRQSLLAYLTGPGTDLVPLQSRIPIQIDAEAQQAGCEYVLVTSVMQKKGKSGGGLGGMFGALGPLAGALPGLGGLAGGAGSMVAAQAASVAASAAHSAALQNMQQQALQQISGATQSNIRKGDQVSLEYTLSTPGMAKPLATKSASAKATDNGMDILMPLIEQVATEVLTVINMPASNG